ncbi:MAG: DNA translocase FtsK [Candidatus Saccharibacteria bacterium]
MADLDEYMYRAEQLVIWEQKANIKQIREAFGVSETTAIKILLTLESLGYIQETDVEGVYTVWRDRATNANEANREIHTLLNAAVRYVRDCGAIGKNDLEKFCIVLGITEAKAVELFEMMRNLGVVEETVMYRALSEEEVSDQDKNWYDPFNSSVQLLDEKGEATMTFKTNLDDTLYPQVEEYVIEQQSASATMLQRRFQIGYARAARLMDALENNFVVGPADGAKPRKVLKPKQKSDD